MPPHPQMALVQALLVRSLVAMFWEQPLTAPLVRWGTGLHEDFLLPHGAIRDIAEVVADLRAHGIDFEESWLDPFTEFRFPRIGVARSVPRVAARASSSSCARRSSRGTCWARRPPPAAPRATSTPRSSGSR